MQMININFNQSYLTVVLLDYNGDQMIIIQLFIIQNNQGNKIFTCLIACVRAHNR